MGTPLEFLTDLWPLFFTDYVTISRMRAVSRAFMGLRLDYSAVSCAIYDGDTLLSTWGRNDDLSEKTLVLYNHQYCSQRCHDSFGGAPFSSCGSSIIAAITIFGGAISARFWAPIHLGGHLRGSGVRTGTGKISPDHLGKPAGRPRVGKKEQRYVIICNGVTYTSSVPGEFLSEVVGRFLPISIEYF